MLRAPPVRAERAPARAPRRRGRVEAAPAERAGVREGEVVSVSVVGCGSGRGGRRGLRPGARGVAVAVEALVRLAVVALAPLFEELEHRREAAGAARRDGREELFIAFGAGGKEQRGGLLRRGGGGRAASGGRNGGRCFFVFVLFFKSN